MTETPHTTQSSFRRAGVIGWPVDHSLSPRVHGFWLRQYGIDGEYVRIPVPPEDFARQLKNLRIDGFVGANVTVPHKEAALAGVDEVHPLAQRIGAVNTVVVREDGSLYGFNTDGFGFLENLKAGFADFSASAGPAVILGAGGAARAVIVALLDAGAPEIRLLNRTKERAEQLADQLSGIGSGVVLVGDWNKRADYLDGASLLANTTTLGMKGQMPLDIDLSALPQTALVNDIVYAPLETDLLARARARSNPTVDGLGMLLHQARPGFEAWFGRMPEVTEALRQHVLAGV
ncbi:shikimate dehydrogenase [Magnetovibrio sp.]|uniref:shikimate dehydrogenase n=1 Tax=Magnetovibrio sp. TaxID=2024836 RepID=UPI002F929723